MIKAAIVGCGKIADAHAWAISMIPGTEIVGVCDNEELMARQLSERFKVGGYFSSLKTMLEAAKPTVVHITTPPQSHFELGRACLEAGCHVYIEKPFTVNSAEAEELIRLADRCGLKVTVGTDEQFSHVAVRMRELIGTGYLGGPPIHMEVYYCYDLGDERYARAFLEDETHWVRRLPGQLIHNVISHGIAKIAEYLEGEDVQVIAHGFSSEFLRNLGEHELIDELRAIIDDGGKRTAYFTFSTQMRPLLREFRVYGPKNGLVLNQDHHSLIKIPGKSYISYADKFIPLNALAREYRKNMMANANLFLKRNLHMKAGMKRLVELFYQSIVKNSQPPISPREIVLTAKIMDSLFAQIGHSPGRPLALDDSSDQERN
jgi:predicted dehydrogenase